MNAIEPGIFDRISSYGCCLFLYTFISQIHCFLTNTTCRKNGFKNQVLPNLCCLSYCAINRLGSRCQKAFDIETAISIMVVMANVNAMTFFQFNIAVYEINLNQVETEKNCA
jgi:hypothetical protein